MNNHETYNRRLADHTIDKVELRKIRAHYPRLHGKNAVKGYHGYGGSIHIAVITTNHGASGWGELCRPASPGTAGEGLVGRKLADVFDAASGILNEAHTAFDMALHDLAGNVLGVSVRRMIHDGAASRARVYDGAIYMNDIIPEGKPAGVERVLEDCAHDYAIGHRMMKVKIGRGHKWMPHGEGMDRDIEIVSSIARMLPDVTLLVDANDGYTYDDCVRFLEGIGNVPVYWFEEPFREEETANRRLRAYLTENRPATWIADGESWTDIDLLMDLAGKGLLDIWQPDICGYGFTAWRALLKKIAPLGYLSSPHAWGQVIKTHYCAHLAAAYPHHIPCVEAVLGQTEGVDYSGYALANGVLSLPDAPGFGMDLFWSEPWNAQ